MACRLFKEQGRATGAQDAVADFRHLEARVDFDADAFEFADAFQLRDEIAELVEFFRDMKGAFKVLRWIGKLAAPMTAIIGLGVALATAWAAARGGLPK